VFSFQLVSTGCFSKMHKVLRSNCKQLICNMLSQAKNGLLNRRRGITATAGSNPALSAIFLTFSSVFL
jgi:hypothetical protein